MIGRNHLTIKAAIESYLVTLKLGGRSLITCQNYRRILEKLAESLGPCQVSRVGPAEMQRYLAALDATGISASSLNVYCIVLKGFWSWLAEQGAIKWSPMTGIKSRTQPWNPVAPFSESEIRRLITAARTPLERAVVFLLLDTGLRVSELLGLSIQDVNMKDGELYVMGKGRKVRHLALNERPKAALLTYLRERSRIEGSIWPGGFSRQKIAYLLDKLGRRANVSRVFPHRFRHTWACEMKRQGVDSLVLQELLGHSSLAMVQRYTAWIRQEEAVQIHRLHPVA